MVRRLAIALAALLPIPVAGVELDVTVRVARLNPGGFVEFKAESDDKGEKATGHLRAVGETRRFRWEMGDADQNIWYWWDTLDGEADLKVVVIGRPRIPVTLFEAPCAHDGKGEVQVGKTLALPVADLDPARHHYRRNHGLPPYIEENPAGAITHIKQADEPNPRAGGGKAGNEWDRQH